MWKNKTRTRTQERVFLRNPKVEQVENHLTHSHTHTHTPTRTHGKIELSFSHFLSLVLSISPFYSTWRHTHAHTPHTLAKSHDWRPFARNVRPTQTFSFTHFLELAKYLADAASNDFFLYCWPTQRKKFEILIFCKKSLAMTNWQNCCTTNCSLELGLASKLIN